jgi:hypothetical protein
MSKGNYNHINNQRKDDVVEKIMEKLDHLDLLISEKRGEKSAE